MGKNYRLIVAELADEIEILRAENLTLRRLCSLHLKEVFNLKAQFEEKENANNRQDKIHRNDDKQTYQEP